MTHSGLGSTDEERKEMIVMTQAYETLFHRTLLKILRYNGKYIDRSTIGFPKLNIDELMGSR